MDLLEYQARALFEAAGLPVLRGITLRTAAEADEHADALRYPAVVKAQVRAGGRGKAGGILFAGDAAQLKAHVQTLLGMSIRGHRVERVMVTEKADIARELYLSILLDRSAKRHLLVFSPCGGMDIEQTAREHPEMIYKAPIDPLLGLSPPAALYFAGKAGLDANQKTQLQTLIQRLYQLFCSHDCTLTEINPLIIDAAGNLLALDAKITIDDSALARLPDIRQMRDEMDEPLLVREARGFGFLYIPCDETGDVVVMSNGSGMLMSCIDQITQRGARVAAVLDLGGGATAERIREAVRVLLRTTGAKRLFINIFGGITRCDEVAEGIRAAVQAYGLRLPIVVRLEGTNKDRGREIIAGMENVVYVQDGLSGVDEIIARGNDR